MMDCFRFRRLDREDFIALCGGSVQADAIAAERRLSTTFLWRHENVKRSPRGLGFVWLLLARANEVFDGFGGFYTLPLLEFGDPVGHRSHHCAGRLPIGFRLVRPAINALSAFHDFDFFL